MAPKVVVFSDYVEIDGNIISKHVSNATLRQRVADGQRANIVAVVRQNLYHADGSPVTERSMCLCGHRFYSHETEYPHQCRHPAHSCFAFKVDNGVVNA